MKLAYTCPDTKQVVKLSGRTFAEIIDGIPKPNQHDYALEFIPPTTPMEKLGNLMAGKFGWIIESFEEAEDTGMCCGGGCCV